MASNGWVQLEAVELDIQSTTEAQREEEEEEGGRGSQAPRGLTIAHTACRYTV